MAVLWSYFKVVVGGTCLDVPMSLELLYVPAKIISGETVKTAFPVHLAYLY